MAALVAAMTSGTMAVQAYEEGDWILRVGAATVSPNEDSDKIIIPTEPATVLRGVDVEVDNSFGFAAQAGVDFPLGEHWGLNAGVWYIDIDTEAKIKTDVGTVKFDVDIDPWVYNIGIAYKL